MRPSQQLAHRVAFVDELLHEAFRLSQPDRLCHKSQRLIRLPLCVCRQGVQKLQFQQRPPACTRFRPNLKLRHQL